MSGTLWTAINCTRRQRQISTSLVFPRCGHSDYVFLSAVTTTPHHQPRSQKSQAKLRHRSKKASQCFARGCTSKRWCPHTKLPHQHVDPHLQALPQSRSAQPMSTKNWPKSETLQTPHISDQFIAHTGNTDFAILFNKDTFEPDPVVLAFKEDSTSKSTW